MPGGGKSTVGRHLARQLKRSFFDTDHEIESRLGEPIRRWFEAHGEEAFRDVEQEVIGALARDHAGCVIATGGGAVLREANRQALRRSATVLYLRSTPEELMRRLRNDQQRPLLQVRDPLQKLRDLYRERDPLYRATAHYVIETGRPSIPSLVNMILMQLELAGLVSSMQVPATVGHERPSGSAS